MDSFMFLCLPDSIAFDLNSIQAHSVSYFLSLWTYVLLCTCWK